jgi:hypothetical protein
LVAFGTATLLLCSGCFMVDDFRIHKGPGRLTTDEVNEPNESTDDTSTDSETSPSSSTDYVKELPLPTLTPGEPPPDAEPSTTSTGPAPPSPSATVSEPTVNPVPSTGGDETEATALDAGSPSEADSTSDAPVVDAGLLPPSSTEPTDGVDAAVEAGATPECDTGWTYDSMSDWCSSDCATDEVQGPSGRCYWFGTQISAFSTARTTCTNRGTGWSAISIRSEEEAEFIEAQLVADTWIGATDQQTPNTWRWIDDNTAFWQGNETGMALNGAYTDWGGEEPSAANDEACARFHSGSGNWYWSDTSCSDQFRAACQGPSPVEPTYDWGSNGGTGSGSGSGGPGSGSGAGFGG